MPKTLIHVGMPRAASTLLQQQVFPRMEGFAFFGVDVTHYGRPFRQMLYSDDTLFDPADFAKAVTGIREKDAVISNELFSGQSAYLNATNRSRTARRLAAAFPEGEIIILLRNQRELLRSLYSIGVYAGNHMAPEAFVHFDTAESERAGAPTYRPTEMVEIYRYLPLITLYRGLFEKVHVMLYEDLRADPSGFLERLSAKTETALSSAPDLSGKVNRSLSARQVALLRKLNKWKDVHEATNLGKKAFRMKARLIERYAGGKNPFRFSPELDARIKAEFLSENAALAKAFPELTESGLFERFYM